MPEVAYGVMFRANKDLFAGTLLVGFINILDPVNGIFDIRFSILGGILLFSWPYKEGDNFV